MDGQKSRLLLILLIAALLLTACGQRMDEPAAETPVFLLDDLPLEENRFWLDELPEIADYQPQQIGSRWYQFYTDRLIPRVDYGQLYPYIARRLTDDIGPNFLFGLSDGEGRIVTDAAYVGIYSCYRPDGMQLLSLERQPARGAGDEEIAHRYQVAAADGSWLLSDLPGELRYADENHLVLADNSTPNWDFGEANIYVYDYDGRQRSAYPGSILSDYANGWLLLHYYDEENPNWYDQPVIRDAEGREYAPAQDAASNLWGLIDDTGVYVFAPQYDDTEELYATMGFGREPVTSDNRRWEQIEVEGQTYTIYSYENGLYSVFSDGEHHSTLSYTGLLNEDMQWLLKIELYIEACI